MPKSKYLPDPNLVQSGYYNDRQGTLDKSLEGGSKDPLRSAAQENTSGRIQSAVSAPGAVQQAPNSPIPDANREEMVDTGGGWYVPKSDPRAAAAAVEDAEGLIDVNALEAKYIQKGGPDYGSYAKKAEPDEELPEVQVEDVEEDDRAIDEEGEELDKGRKVTKHYGPASEDSTHPEVHNATDDTGLDRPEDAKRATAKVTKSGFGLDEMEEWIQKSETAQRRRLKPETALAVLDTFLGEDTMTKSELSGHNQAGQGGFPEAGAAPSSLPTSQRPTDGDGDRMFTQREGGPSDAGMESTGTTVNKKAQGGKNNQGKGMDSAPLKFDDITFDNEDDDFQRRAGGQRLEGLAKGFHGGYDTPLASDQGLAHRSRTLAALHGVDFDMSIGIGVAPARSAHIEKSEEPVALGAMSTDELVQQAFDVHGDGSNSFASLSVPGVDLRSPLLNGRECGACGELMKSYLTTCDVCGADHSARPVTGPSYDDDVRKSLTPQLEDDIVI